MTFAFIWITLGFMTNIYYLVVNSKHHEEMLNNGEIKPINLFVGVALTFILWPISIYNNEFKK
jgi:hypothetical protein